MRVRSPYAKTLILAALACGATMVAPIASADRLYDREHGDYHNWDDSEDVQFRLYLGERNEPYREFREMDADHQRAYWRWRHEHHERHDPDRN
jgi:hypothetical protein